jgi:hypothetical protein
MEDSVFEVVSIYLSLFFLITYNLLVYLGPALEQVLHLPTPKNQMGRNLNTAMIWISKHSEKSDAASVTLAIQTFRNTILIAIFVGGAAFQTAISLINAYSHQSRLVIKMRTIIVSSLLFLSFLSWASVIRAASHLGYITSVLSYDAPSIASPQSADHSIMDSGLEEGEIDMNREKADQENQRSNLRIQETHLMSTMLISFRFSLYPPSSIQSPSLFFSLGFRFIFVSIPFLLLFAGAEVLIISTFIVVVFLGHWDFGLQTAVSAIRRNQNNSRLK